MTELIPSILVESHEEFERRLRLVDPHVKTVHVDVLDGTLFPHMSWHDARVVGDIETSVAYELHLMVENPLPIIEAWKRYVKTLTRAIVHAEIDRPLSAILDRVRMQHHLESGIALNPETPVTAIHEHMDNIDSVLVMGVHPGASGQTFLGESVLEKIRYFHREYPTLPIGCDGGITAELLPSISEAGCARFILASQIFGAENPSLALERLREKMA